MENDFRPSADALESVHSFPGVYRIKAIGKSVDEFHQRVIEATVIEVAGHSEIEYTVRETAGGRHVAVTLDITVQTAEQVRRIYANLQALDGLVYLF